MKSSAISTITKSLPIVFSILVNYSLSATFCFNYFFLEKRLLKSKSTQLINISNVAIQPFLVGLGMAEYQLGYLYSIAAAIGIVASFSSRSFKKFNTKNVVSIVILIIIVVRLSFLFVFPPFFIVACIIFIINYGLFALLVPITQPFLHQFIPGKIRATTLLISSMLNQLAIAISSLLVGAFLDFFGAQKVLAFTGLCGFIAIFFYQKIKI